MLIEETHRSIKFNIHYYYHSSSVGSGRSDYFENCATMTPNLRLPTLPMASGDVNRSLITTSFTAVRRQRVVFIPVLIPPFQHDLILLGPLTEERLGILFWIIRISNDSNARGKKKRKDAVPLKHCPNQNQHSRELISVRKTSHKHTLYLLACQVRVTVRLGSLLYGVCVTSFER